VRRSAQDGQRVAGHGEDADRFRGEAVTSSASASAAETSTGDGESSQLRVERHSRSPRASTARTARGSPRSRQGRSSSRPGRRRSSEPFIFVRWRWRTYRFRRDPGGGASAVVGYHSSRRSNKQFASERRGIASLRGAN